MADARATYAIDLEDGTSGAAESAASALTNLKRRLDADTAALAEMNKAMRNLKGATTPSLDAVKKLSDRIAEQKQKIAAGQGAILDLGGSFGKVRAATRPTKDAFGDLTKQAQQMPGPLGGVVGRLSNLRGMLAGGAVSVGVMAVAAGLAALAVAAVAATAALLKYGIAQAGARRAELLQLQGLTKVRNFWGVAAGSATELQGAIDKVAGSSALGRDKIAGYARELYQSHLRGNQLELALEAAAIKGAVLGDEAAKGAMQLAAGMNASGRSVKALSDDIKARFGGTAAAMMLDLGVQAEKLRENFAALFSGLKIEALLSGISSVTSLFSQATRSGQALRTIMQTMLQPLIDGIAATAPIVKRFFQGIIIGGLLVGIGLLYIRRAWRSVFGKSELVNSGDLMRVALGAGVVAATLLTGVLVALMAPLAGVAAYFYGLATAAAFVWKWITKAYDKIAAIEWSALGRSIVSGIVDGIKGAAAWLLSVIENLGTDTLNALSKKLGIASPSRMFARLGEAIPAGVEVGVDKGAPGARRAVAGIVDAPSMPDAAAGGAADAGTTAPGGRAGAITIEVGGIVVNSSAEKPAELVADIETELVRMLEGVAAQLGALVPRGAV